MRRNEKENWKRCECVRCMWIERERECVSPLGQPIYVHVNGEQWTVHTIPSIFILENHRHAHAIPFNTNAKSEYYCMRNEKWGIEKWWQRNTTESIFFFIHIFTAVPNDSRGWWRRLYVYCVYSITLLWFIYYY